MGASEGVRRVASIRHVGANCRWGAEGFSVIRGAPWSRNPDAAAQQGDLRVRVLTEEEKRSGRPEVFGGEKNIYRRHLRRGDFANHGFTGRCQAALSGTSGQGHSEVGLTRMGEALMRSP